MCAGNRGVRKCGVKPGSQNGKGEGSMCICWAPTALVALLWAVWGLQGTHGIKG